MATRSSSSSSSSSSSDSEAEGITIGTRAVSTASDNRQQTASSYRAVSSTGSQNSAAATGTPYDTVSITTTNTGFTNTTNMTANTSISQQQGSGRSIPIIRPPVLNSQQQLSGTNINAVNQPIQIDVTSAQQQYQQHAVQSEISPYNGSSTSSSGGSLSSPGSTSVQQQQQPRFNVNQGISQQVGNQISGQYQYQQTQFANQLLNANAYSDTTLHIDYGVIEAYNVGLQSAGDITAEQLAPRFNAAKAIFKQADTNHDGSINPQEFQQWAQGGQQNLGGQSYSNYQAASTTNNYGNNYASGQSYGETNPEIANILQQSGLTQGYNNYR